MNPQEYTLDRTRSEDFIMVFKKIIFATAVLAVALSSVVTSSWAVAVEKFFFELWDVKKQLWALSFGKT